MALYNSSDLTKYILDLAHVGEGRTAISLNDGDDGPFLLVERNGRSVTYLDKGMKVKEATILPYSQLATIVERIADWRERLEAAGKLIGPGGNVFSLLRRLLDAGHELTREEFHAISAWQPVFRGQMLSLLVRLVREGVQERYELRKLRRIRKQDEPQLRKHWNRAWAIGHLTLLVAMEGREYIEELPEELAWARGERLSYFAMSQDLLPIALRGTWAVGEVGRPVLEAYRDGFLQPKSPTAFLNAGLGLLAVAAHHGRLLGQIRKTIARTVELPLSFSSAHDWMRTMQRWLIEVTDLVFDDREKWHRELEAALRKRFIERLVPRLKPDSQFRYSDPQEIPFDLLLAMMGSTPASHAYSNYDLHLLYQTVPLVAVERAESLFFPQALQADLIDPWTPEWTMALIRSRRLEQPKRAAPKPGQNSPCSCGSGIKYKRCHGR